MTDLFNWLLDGSPFEDRWHCIRHSAGVGWTLFAANGVTWLVYWLMAFPLVKVYRAHRAALGSAWLLAGTAAFIALCGTHHLFYVVAFRYPTYRLMAVSDVLMAATSAAMCIAFFALADPLCGLRPASECDAERDAKDAAIAELVDARRDLDEQNIRLSNTVNDLRRNLAIYDAHYDRDRAHREIIQAIESIGEQLPGPPGVSARPPEGP